MLHPPSKPDPITYFAQTDSRGRRTPFGIKAPDRSRHMYVIGKTGMGKSTVLENMAIQDIRGGNGFAFIDPHGKTADLLLDYVPESRVKDVLYFAPFDMEYPIAFNIMEDVGPDRRHLVVNGLMSTFEKIWVDAWSARMAYILQNTLLALLEYPGSTLLGVNRLLVDKEYRRLVVGNITDPSVRAFWVDEFAKYTDRYTQEATPAIQNKVGQFTANPLIRNIVGQPKSTFDLRTMMDERKIVIVNLSKGKVGEGNANLLGSMIITKVYLAAMSRADMTERELQKLPDFYLYVDEFQSFANKSFADILSEARKYKLNLTLAHQYIEQMEEEVRAAVFGNVGTMAVFRVGAFDAEVLEKEFAPAITAEDLVNLGIYQIYLKLMIDGVTSSPFSAVTIPPIEQEPQSYREQIIAHSRAAYARPRAVVETEIKDWHAPTLPPPKVRKEGNVGVAALSAARGEVRQQAGERPPRPSAPPERRFHPGVESRFEPAAPPAFAPNPAPLPLSTLRPGAKKEPVGGAHPLGETRDLRLSELRKALKEALSHSPNQPSEAPHEKSPLPSAGSTAPLPHATSLPPKDVAPRPSAARLPDGQGRAGEVPEEMLRKLLEVPNPEARGQQGTTAPPANGTRPV